MAERGYPINQTVIDRRLVSSDGLNLLIARIYVVSRGEPQISKYKKYIRLDLIYI
jgi:hypothetical protein